MNRSWAEVLSRPDLRKLQQRHGTMVIILSKQSSWEHKLSKIFSLGVNHVSVYPLTVKMARRWLNKPRIKTLLERL